MTSKASPVVHIQPAVLTRIISEITAEITVFRYSSEKLTQELRKKVAVISTPRITEMSKSLVRSLAKDALMEDKNEDLLESEW